MATTYEKIATTTLGSAASTITFSSISSAYTDLRIVVIGKSTTDSVNLNMQFNGDTGTNYSQTILSGRGATVSSIRTTSDNYIGLTAYAGLMSTQPTGYIIDIFSYAGSTYKTVLANCFMDSNGAGAVEVRVGLWRSTDAINQIIINRTGGNYNTGTIATLYGIKNA
jgi:hypothetical protein